MTASAVRLEVSPVDDGLRVSYLSAGDGSEVAPSRRLRLVGSAPWTFPLPPAAEAAGLAAASPHKVLCDSADGENLIDGLAGLQARQSGSPVTVTMGRYLFAVLLGDAWPTLRDRLVASQSLRLELQWSSNDAVLGRLPWEMLHDGDGFLALRDGVTLVRRVEGPAATLAPASTPLDVLFVVGQALRGDVIRPAAEYLALVQNLQALDLDRHLRPRLLLEATSESLEAALAERRPAVVHFMTHGHYEADRPYLQLCSSASAGPAPLTAAQLLELLKNGARSDIAEPLPIIVLSACETASSRQTAKQGDGAAPFAAQLVAGGVPVAVGMTGRVNDLACRLFARTFYSALLSGNDLVEATAEGRRAAFKHETYDPEVAYDWALPTLFVSSRLQSSRMTVQEAPLAAGRQKLARFLRPGERLEFCDRWPILAAGEALLADGAVQRRFFRRGGQQILALSTDYAARRARSGETYGHTWTLQTLASRAALAGHVPCIVSGSLGWGLGIPTSWRDFVESLKLSMEVTSTKLGVTHRPCVMTNYLLGGPKPVDLPDELSTAVPSADAPAGLAMARALRLDLLALLDAVRAQLPEAERPKCRLLLLIDDLHQLSDLATDLLKHVFGPAGLDRCSEEVRIVFTWALRGELYATTIKRIVDWLGHSRATEVFLDRFQDLEERLAYQNFLSQYKEGDEPRPLALVHESEAMRPLVESFFAKLGQRIEGIPSELHKATDVIDVYLGMPESVRILVEARDEDVVRQWLAAGGPPP